MADNIDDRTITPFSSTLIEHRKGRLHAELGEALNELVKTVQELQKPGKLNLTLSISPAGKLTEMVVVTDEIKLTLPKPDPEQSLFFVDEDANLSRHNKVAPELPLRVTVDNTTGEILTDDAINE